MLFPEYYPLILFRTFIMFRGNESFTLLVQQGRVEKQQKREKEGERSKERGEAGRGAEKNVELSKNPFISAFLQAEFYLNMQESLKLIDTHLAPSLYTEDASVDQTSSNWLIF